MRFASLGSGSRGNATLIEAGATRLLVDCGLTARDAERRLALLGVVPAELRAILLTHEHSDHVRGVLPLATRYGLEVWSTPGTWRGLGGPELPGLRLFTPHNGSLHVGDLRLIPFPVPHDAREPAQLVVEHAGTRLGVLTDAGSVTAHARALLAECDALVLECNHDVELLRAGPYPPSVQARVAGNFGHLSNDQAAGFIDQIPHQRLRHLLIAHVSVKNNRPELARDALLQVSADLAPRLTLSEQDRPTGWLGL
jgi:phosphoribosyl 1,2-cyclic phosphodiesterase